MARGITQEPFLEPVLASHRSCVSTLDQRSRRSTATDGAVLVQHDSLLQELSGTTSAVVHAGVHDSPVDTIRQVVAATPLPWDICH